MEIILTKKQTILIFCFIFLFFLFLVLFMLPYSKLVCKDNICTMYSKSAILHKYKFEYSFVRTDIHGFIIQPHTHTTSNGTRGGGSTTRYTYSLVLILRDDHSIHLPFEFGKRATKDFYQDLKSNNDVIYSATEHVYRFK